MNFWSPSGLESGALYERYLAAGVPCSIQTNSDCILAAARQSFTLLHQHGSSGAMSMRLWVDSDLRSGPPWPPPYYRGLNHLVFAAFDHDSALLFDLRRRCVTGRLSAALASDVTYWRENIFPAIFGIMSEALGVTALHCACVVRDGKGLLLAGNSGSGKSTLSLALSQIGFEFLSDDWTYFSRPKGPLLAWGLSSPLKLLPDVVQHFPELAPHLPRLSGKGELAYRLDPANLPGVSRAVRASPRAVIFLRRRPGTCFDLLPMAVSEAIQQLEQDLEELPPGVSGQRPFHLATIRRIAEHPCWTLEYGGSPRAVAQALDPACWDEHLLPGSV